jgi:hypothetical protein
MADCYYHGQSSPGPCPECEEERRRGLPQGTLDVPVDIMSARAEASRRDMNLPLGLDPNGRPLKKKVRGR